ncbi:MAG: VOC family protein [Bacteroidales bacterium]|nr:VOC family protein [Bacteroidales bacterium]
MSLQFHSSVLFCSNLKKQREFYEKFLEQKVKQDYGRCVVFASGFTLWSPAEEYPVSKELGYTYEPLGNRNLELCFETDSFEDAVEKVLMSDLRILHNVTEEPWGQYTIRFYDPEGNLVEIGETLKSMAKRMRLDGMSEDEIAGKSGLDKSFVIKLLAI